MNSFQHAAAIKGSRILLVDDHVGSLTALERVLVQAGYTGCRAILDSRVAIQEFLAAPPDLLLLDWHMTPVPGAQMLEELKRCIPEQQMPPILILTADDTPETKADALELGVADFLAKPLDRTEVLLRIRNLLQLWHLHQEIFAEKRSLDDQVRERTAQLRRAMDELEQVQAQSIQQERLLALAAMASGIAHDFNNALTIIQGYGDMLLGHEHLRANPATLVEYLESMVTASRDASGLVRRLQTFSRPHDPADDTRETLELNRIVDEAVQLSLPRWKTQTQVVGLCIQMDVQLGSVPPIFGVAVELREILINLIFNAVDAMPQGGTLTVRTRERDGRVELQVEDTGTGMTEQTRRRCLEPFFTTKGERGSGLGLSTTYGIVQRHQGRFEIATELNHGTCFSVLLPPAPEATTQPEIERTMPAPARRLHVLVVDDQPDICTVMVNYLSIDHHVVVTAENGCVALEKFQRDRFDLVITDRAMPKMNGDQLATAIRELAPDEPIILMTAFTQPKRLSADVDALIRKPLSLGSIRNAMNEVLAKRGGARAVAA